MTTGPSVDKLRTQYDHKLPFVAYRKPHEEIVHAFLQKQDKLYTVKDFTESGFIMAPFDDDANTILIPEAVSERLSFKMAGPRTRKNNATTVLGHSEKQDRHLLLVEKALSKLETGELEKVVLSRKETLSLSDADPFDLFQNLLQSYPMAFVYLWYHPRVGCWLAATPETLVLVRGLEFKTMALAGTRKYEGNLDVKWGEKEKKEQQIVVDEILQNIRPFVSDIHISETGTTRAGNLLHLETNFQGRIMDSERGLQKIISALHPTPAVCGLPKDKAREFIKYEEEYDREFYTGFLGELNLQKNMQRSRNSRNVENLAYRSVMETTSLFVNLRCMKLEESTATIFVGGGITRESDPQAEWEETVNKAQTMKKVLQ